MAHLPMWLTQIVFSKLSQSVNVGLYDERYQNVHHHKILYLDQNFMSKYLKNAVFTGIKGTFSLNMAFERLFGQ